MNTHATRGATVVPRRLKPALYESIALPSGLEPDVIAEAHLDAASILAGIQRFARDRESRIARQRELIAKL